MPRHAGPGEAMGNTSNKHRAGCTPVATERFGRSAERQSYKYPVTMRPEYFGRAAPGGRIRSRGKKSSAAAAPTENPAARHTIPPRALFRLSQSGMLGRATPAPPLAHGLRPAGRFMFFRGKLRAPAAPVDETHIFYATVREAASGYTSTKRQRGCGPPAFLPSFLPEEPHAHIG